jgi:hypothetical protein
VYSRVTELYATALYFIYGAACGSQTGFFKVTMMTLHWIALVVPNPTCFDQLTWYVNVHAKLLEQETGDDSQAQDLENEGPTGKHAPRTRMHRGTSFRR